MVLSIGKDYDYVRNEMDIPRLRALNAYQRDYPPTNIGVQRLCRILEAFMGIEENTNDIVSEDDDSDLIDDLMNFPQGG